MKIEEKYMKNEYEWINSFAKFTLNMHRKIIEHMVDRGTSWKLMSEQQLQEQLEKYKLHKEWESVANIAFMLRDNEKVGRWDKTKLEKIIEENNNVEDKTVKR